MDRREKGQEVEGVERQVVGERVAKQLADINTINWMRKRAAGKAQIQYLNNSSQLEEHQAIVRVFEKFDVDGDGVLEAKELRGMFEKNNIDISKKQLMTLFAIVDEDKSGTLDINEFKDFALSHEANKHFRDMINELRHRETYKHIENRARFLPFNFSTLLNFLSDEARKENLRDQIDPKDNMKAQEKNYSAIEVQEDLKRFVELFKSEYNNQTAKASDPLGRQINTALELRRSKEKLEEEIFKDPLKMDKNSKSQVSGLDIAKLKVSAMRRSTIRKRDNSFKMDKAGNRKTQRFIKDINELDISKFEDQSDTEYSLSVEIERKGKGISKGYEMNNINSKTQKKVHNIIKQAIQNCETISKNRIKNAKRQPKVSDLYSSEKYGTSESLYSQRNLKQSPNDSKAHRLVIKNKPRLRKIFYKKRKNKPQLRLKSPTDLNRMSPSYSTKSEFYNSQTPNVMNFPKFSPQCQGKDCDKQIWSQMQKNSVQSTHVSPIQQRDSRLQSTSTVEVTNFKPYSMYSAQSGSSIKDKGGRSAPKIRTTVRTPYQIYKLSKNKNKKRPVFQNKFIPRSAEKLQASRKSASVGQFQSPMKDYELDPNLNLDKIEQEPWKKFINILGEINPELKEKTLMNYKKLNHIRANMTGSGFRRNLMTTNSETVDANKLQ
ncbi:unnamed protein product [Moneuplotes crassus]|uniref:EF-hand domain-containing protein n=1 Tax=Euplotes crassus TaxID=5936 RepID=A0AAD1XHQ0_EUPCR|nr:unnamed protein product [Moneuplotes crassus]